MCKSMIADVCPVRILFLRLEHEALLAIRSAETSTEFPLAELGAFMGQQVARWRHEEICPACAQHRKAAA
jgi:hypothetical protein